MGFGSMIREKGGGWGVVGGVVQHVSVFGVGFDER